MGMTDLGYNGGVDGVFSGMRGFVLVPTHPDSVPVPGEPRFIGTVHITGSWCGSVAIELPEPFARIVAGAMFGNAPTDVADDEVVDVVGELANMTGGNVKALVEGDCSLSLP